MTTLEGYYIVERWPIKVLSAEDGGTEIYKFNRRTGDFEPGVEYLEDLLFNRNEVRKVSEDEFIQYVEEVRGEYLRGEGEVYTLYEFIREMQEMARAEDRPFTPEERALVVGLRRKTHQLFEAELQRRKQSPAEEAGA